MRHHCDFCHASAPRPSYWHGCADFQAEANGVRCLGDWVACHDCHLAIAGGLAVMMAEILPRFLATSPAGRTLKQHPEIAPTAYAHVENLWATFLALRTGEVRTEP